MNLAERTVVHRLLGDDDGRRLSFAVQDRDCSVGFRFDLRTQKCVKKIRNCSVRQPCPWRNMYWSVDACKCVTRRCTAQPYDCKLDYYWS